jgi:hypothetical protein
MKRKRFTAEGAEGAERKRIDPLGHRRIDFEETQGITRNGA